MKERICPFCGAIALSDFCERCGLEMPELAKTLSEKSPNLKKDLTPIESYEMHKSKKKSNSFFTIPFNESQVASQIRNYFMKYILTLDRILLENYFKIEGMNIFPYLLENLSRFLCIKSSDIEIDKKYLIWIMIMLLGWFILIKSNF